MERGNVLLIDDNKTELRLLQEAFNGTDFPRDIKTFTDGQTAYNYIAENAKDVFLILCDIKMPGMSGSELLEKINENPELKMASIPFIFLTNSVQDEDILKCYSLAPQGYFQKPFKLEEMTHLFKLIIYYWTAAFIPHHKYQHTIL